ncbi:P-loop NTPase fold protein [Flavobacterium anhuiense]|uniref:P-loop NTPase fold protein n=1 Tax=Flavobacterium anhuiense TaxID=459526 RepID=UPI000E6C4BFF|nr:P-loop NTPase fold protein [Flavobacterium anhuiense]
MENYQNSIKIETKEISTDFKNHLKIENNKRILFSGPFGTGKSTFLNEFSNDENDDFFYLKIFPVNYSISQNEDVFELIKFDLLFQLMGNYYNEIELKKEDFSLLLKSQMFIMERLNSVPILYAILGFSEKIGAPIVDFIKALGSTVGDFKKFNEEIKEDEKDDIEIFIKSIENKKGNKHEMDAISELIFNLIERIRNVNLKSSVLIIDDLDRLDPDHVFRIFNIFSAHYEEINDKNKFGFDKVVFVCDIENIRKIFHHKYGSDVDFSGYIDKFYSISPFEFDNRADLKTKIGKLLHKIPFHSDLTYYRFDQNVAFLKCAKAVVQALIDSKQLNLRMLLICPILNVPDFYFGKRQTPGGTPIIVLFYFLKNFYGSFEILGLKLKNLSELFNSETFRSDHNSIYVSKDEYDINILLSFCLTFLLPDDLANKSSDQIENYYSEYYNCTFHYSIDRYSNIKNLHQTLKICIK